MTRRGIMGIVLALTLGLFATALQANPTLERMKERLPKVDELKLQGLVGENNQGFLEVRGSMSAEQQAIVNAENRDRRDLYTQVARSSGTTPETVGQQRAIRNAQLAARGVWLQKPNGEWYRK